MISQDPKEWGPPTWVFLDAVMNTIPPEMNNHSELRQDLDQFWAALYLPCAECRVHFREFMEKQPFSTVPNDTTELRAWYQALKDHVYSKKPIPTPSPQTQPQTQPIPTLYTPNPQHAKTMERMRQQRWRTQAMRTGMIGWTSSLSRSANNSLRTASSSVSNSLSRNTSSGSSKSSGGGGCKTCGGLRVSR
jgi:hypothetical protein